MDAVVIRCARASDAGPLSDCMEAAYAPWSGRLEGLPDVAGGMDDEISQNTVFIAEVNGGVVGGIVIAWHSEQAGHVVNLGVRPDAAGQGIGRTLLARAEAEAQKRGVERMQLGTHLGMEATQSFYRALGWTETGRDKVRVSFEKQLGPSD